LAAGFAPKIKRCPKNNVATAPPTPCSYAYVFTPFKLDQLQHADTKSA